MPDVDLSTLSAAELRDLLDSTRQRGQAAQSYQILQEMAERRTRPARGSSAQPRVIALDFGDPLETFDEEPARPDPVAIVREAKADDAFAADLSLSLDHRPPRRRKAPPRTSKAERDPPPPPSPAPRRRFPVFGFSVGVALGLVMGLGLGIQSRPLPADPAAAVFPQAPALRPQAAAAAVPPATVAAPPPAPAAEVDTAAIPGPPAPTTSAQATPEPPPAAPTTRAAPASAAREPATSPEPAAPDIAKPVESAAAEPPATAKACANAPTPADRTICGDPRLLRLQKELRAAYARALDAHSDRATLRQRQLAWAEARNGVTDPDRLAELYEARIKRLDAATEAARRAR